VIADPWSAARRVLASVALVERQPIAPVPGGQSFASSGVVTPLHTDSMSWDGVPPDRQVMLCDRPAGRGGETLLVDTHALLTQLERDDAALHRALFTEPRLQRFVFGDVRAPTAVRRGEQNWFTHSPRQDDAIGLALAPHLARCPRVSLRIEAGELLVVDNHRLLHGRDAFDDPQRRFQRLLAWTHAPDGREGVAERLLSAGDGWVGAAPAERRIERRATLDLLRGVPPGALATRLGVPEPRLYQWREAALREMP
jgi:gamma-butyrobetaine dioxygenase